jgi:hypothetical protein
LVNKIVINNIKNAAALKRIEDSNHGNKTYFKIRKCINIIARILEHVQNNKILNFKFFFIKYNFINQR